MKSTGARSSNELQWFDSNTGTRIIAPAMVTLSCLRADSMLAPSQWETSLQSNTVTHWLGTNLESALMSFYFQPSVVGAGEWLTWQETKAAIRRLLTKGVEFCIQEGSIDEADRLQYTMSGESHWHIKVRRIHVGCGAKRFPCPKCSEQFYRQIGLNRWYCQADGTCQLGCHFSGNRMYVWLWFYCLQK